MNPPQRNPFVRLFPVKTVVATAAALVIVFVVALVMLLEPRQPAVGGIPSERAAVAARPPERVVSDGRRQLATEVLDASPWSLSVLDHESREPIRSFTWVVVPVGRDDLSTVEAPQGEGHDGMLTLDVPSAYPACLVVCAEGYVPHCGRVVVASGSSETVALQRARLRITGRVVEAVSKEPLEGARVWVAGPDDKVTVRHGRLDAIAAISGPDGWFSLAGAGPAEQLWRLEAWHADHVRESLAVSASDGPVMIELRRGPRIHGTVQDGAGRPLPGVSVVVDGMPLLTDARGGYHSCALERGGHSVTARLRGPEGESTLAMRGAVVEDHDVRVDFGGAAALVQGRVGLRNGSSPVGCRVLFRGGDRTELVIPVDAVGRFSAALPMSGSWRVCVARGRDWLYHEERELVRLPRAEPLLLEVPGSTIRGVVCHADGTPVTGRSLPVEDVTARVGHSPRIVRTDSAGRFEIGSLAPGRHELRLNDGALVAVEQPPVDVAEDRIVEGIRLVVAPCCTLVVRLPGVSRWERTARATLRGRDVRPGVKDVPVGSSELRYGFWQIPAGDYELEVQLGVGIDRRRIHLDAGEQRELAVRVDPQAGCIQGRVTPLRRCVGTSVWAVPAHGSAANSFRARRHGAIDELGGYEIPCLDDGVWAVHASIGGKEQPMGTVHVSRGATARLDLALR